MRRIGLVAVALGAMMALAQPAAAQQNQNNGWGGALDQLNRAVNPNSYPEDRPEDRRTDNDRSRRSEGSSTDRRADGGDYEGYSDRDLRDRYDHLIDEQRRTQRERRAMEDEMSRRGIRR